MLLAEQFGARNRRRGARGHDVVYARSASIISKEGGGEIGRDSTTGHEAPPARCGGGIVFYVARLSHLAWSRDAVTGAFEASWLEQKSSSGEPNCRFSESTMCVSFLVDLS